MKRYSLLDVSIKIYMSLALKPKNGFYIMFIFLYLDALNVNTKLTNFFSLKNMSTLIQVIIKSCEVTSPNFQKYHLLKIK